MNGMRWIYLLLILWAVAFVLSIGLAMNVDGGRDLEAGLARLDVFARGQLVALAFAIASAVAVFVVRGLNRSQKLIGMAPLVLTVVLVSGLFIVATLRVNALTTPTEQPPPPRPPVTEPMPTVPVDEQG